MFSLKSLLLAVLVAAVFIVALLNRSPIWASVIVTMTVLLLAVALVGIYLLPDKRPFLVCAVIVGLVYGAAAFVRPLGLWESLLSTRVLHDAWFSRDVGRRRISRRQVGGVLDVIRRPCDVRDWIERRIK